MMEGTLAKKKEEVIEQVQEKARSPQIFNYKN